MSRYYNVTWHYLIVLQIVKFQEGGVISFCRPRVY